MNDDRILEAVRTGLDGAHMHRPVSAIFHRARVRRSSSAVAVGGLALGVTAALTIPFVHSGSGGPSSSSGSSSASSSAGSSGGSSVALKPVSFTLVQAADGHYTFDVVPGVPLDLPAVERALANIGITAIVRTNEKCDGAPLDAVQGRLFRLNVHPDDSVSITLDSRHFPANGTLSLTLGLDSHGVLRMAGFNVYRTGTQTSCSTVSVFPVGSR